MKPLRLLSLLALVAVSAAAAQPPAAPTHKGMSIHVDKLRVIDEDDPLSNDEPYLVVTRFQFRAEVGRDGRSVSILPGTLQVANIMSGHGNLRDAENWADEGKDYTLTPRYAQGLFKRGEEGWVVGAVYSLFEKDGFSASSARLLSDRVKDAVEKALKETRFSAADGRTISSAIIRKITRDLNRALKNLNVGGIIRGLASAVDPDDYGGSQIALTVLGPGAKVFSYVGLPTADVTEALMDVREVSRQREFTMEFPAGDLSDLPGNARFKGKYRFSGLIKAWDQAPLY